MYRSLVFHFQFDNNRNVNLSVKCWPDLIVPSTSANTPPGPGPPQLTERESKKVFNFIISIFYPIIEKYHSLLEYLVKKWKYSKLLNLITWLIILVFQQQARHSSSFSGLVCWLFLHNIQLIAGLTGKSPERRSLMIIDSLLVLHDVIGQ